VFQHSRSLKTQLAHLSILAGASSTTPLSCLTWFLPSSSTRVRSYGFDRPSPPFDRAIALGPEVFRTFLDIRVHFYHRLQPSAAPQRHVASIRVCLPGCTVRRFAPTFRICTPPDRNRALAPAPTPPELCRPSGGVIAGVRSSRDYHPRHLPPLTFLKPSTVCTSSRLACSVSHRHHL